MNTNTQALEVYAQQTIVAFHIGRGGQFHNAGHRTYLGEKKIGDFIGDLFLNEEEGDLNQGMYYDGGGNYVDLSAEDVASGIGTIDIDGDYDTTYCQKVADCSDSELRMIYDEQMKFDGRFADQSILGYCMWKLDIEEETEEAE